MTVVPPFNTWEGEYKAKVSQVCIKKMLKNTLPQFEKNPDRLLHYLQIFEKI